MGLRPVKEPTQVQPIGPNQTRQQRSKGNALKRDLQSELVHISRVAKVVKGGKRFAFAALVVVGDGNGQIGHGHGKAREVAEAVRKATEAAERNLVTISLSNRNSLNHDSGARYGGAKVVIRSAPSGTGIIAGGAMRAVFDMLGVSNVVAKSLGSSNAYNLVRATFKALRKQETAEHVAKRRNVRVADLHIRQQPGRISSRTI